MLDQTNFIVGCQSYIRDIDDCRGVDAGPKEHLVIAITATAVTSQIE